MPDDNARSGFESNPSPDGFSAMPSDLSVNGAARGQTPAWTPGPWKVAGPFNSQAYGWRINEVRIKDRHGEDDIAVIGYDFTDDDAKAAVMADAHLIAAAPELADFAARFEAAAGFLIAGLPTNHAVAKDLIGLREAARLALSLARGECDSKGGA